VGTFNRIPAVYAEAAKNLRLLYMDRSVGGNISDALSCLASPWQNAASACKRYQHRDSAYAVDPSEVHWDGTWDRSKWRYEYWPQGCSEDANCFIDFAEPRIDSFDVFGFQFSYLAVMPGALINHPVDGFFGSRTDIGNAKSYAAFAARHPEKQVIWWTTSLARGIGSPESEEFNNAMRQYTRSNNLILFDVADILSHAPDGQPCYDNRDGIAYLTENNPDDALSIPAICPQYTTETEGGHLGSISAGGIRVAKAFWVLMARIAGWDGISGANDSTSPQKVLLVSPLNNANVSSADVTFRWNASSPSVTHYRLEHSTSQDFSNVTFSDSTIVDTFHVNTQIPLPATLWWHVQARNNDGWGAWSDAWQFIHIPVQQFNTTPLTEMGKSLYQNFDGGLYRNGVNERPAMHNAAGISIAHTVVPLDTIGRPEPKSGKIVLLSLGMSNTTQEFSAFQNVVDTFTRVNPMLVVVDGAQGGQTASIIKKPNANFWNVIMSQRLPEKKVTAQQVQAIWLKEGNSAPTEPFPIHASMLKDDLTQIVKLLLEKFPNLKLVYLSSRTYAGYATTQLNPEPYAFESGFSVQWLIDEQVQGDTTLSYSAPFPKSPWLSWGPYLWGNGANPRLDNGLVWLRRDFVADGTHPSNSGVQKVAEMLLDFFSTDNTTIPWFLETISTGTGKTMNAPDLSLTISPNPVSQIFTVKISALPSMSSLEVFDLFGRRLAVLRDKINGGNDMTMSFDASFLPTSGMYLLRLSTPDHIFLQRFVKLK